MTDIYGVSARAMLAAILAGERDVETLADLARGRLRAKRDQLKEALEGRVTAHHSFLLTEHLSTLEYLDEAIARISGEMDQRLTAEQEAIALLDTIPGVGQRAAEILIAEIGTDMSRFPSAKHLASWAGMCPGNHESGGKRLQREDAQRESLAAADPRRNCPCRVQNEKHVSRGPIQADCGTTRQETGSDCGRAYHLDDRVYDTDTAAALPGSGRGIL